MLKVGYDAQAFLSPNRGTGKGLQLRNLLGPYINQFVGFASNEPNPSGMPLIQEGAAGHNAWEQFSLPGSLRRHKIKIFLAPYNVAPLFVPRGIDLILVLHDTILMQDFRKPDRKGRLMDAYRRWQIPYSVRRARIVLTVSEHARGEILKAFPRADVRVIPCTIPIEWFNPAPLEGREGYLLMVSSSAPHKNADGAIEAYAQYARRAGKNARPFKIVGLTKQAGRYMPRLTELGVASLVTFMPYVSESELIGLYQGAAALLFPSFAEGFGIPMLEAMATGTPVIAARATSLPEVGGDAACYFNPRNLEEMTEAIGQVLGDAALRAQMAERGLRRAQVYSPSVIEELVIRFWHEVAGVSPSSPIA